MLSKHLIWVDTVLQAQGSNIQGKYDNSVHFKNLIINLFTLEKKMSASEIIYASGLKNTSKVCSWYMHWDP